MIFWLPWYVESVTLNRIGEEESRPANRTKIWSESEAIHKGVVHDKTAFARRVRRFRVHAVSRGQRPSAGGGPSSRGPDRAGDFRRGRRNGGSRRQREEGRLDRHDQRGHGQPGPLQLSFVEARVRGLLRARQGDRLRTRSAGLGGRRPRPGPRG